MKVIISNADGKQDQTLQYGYTTKVEDLKKEYITKAKLNCRVEELIFNCNANVLKNDQLVYTLRIDDDEDDLLISASIKQIGGKFEL